MYVYSTCGRKVLARFIPVGSMYFSNPTQKARTFRSFIHPPMYTRIHKHTRTVSSSINPCAKQEVHTRPIHPPPPPDEKNINLTTDTSRSHSPQQVPSLFWKSSRERVDEAEYVRLLLYLGWGIPKRKRDTLCTPCYVYI